jgi:hypothetical protein
VRERSAPADGAGDARLDGPDAAPDDAAVDSPRDASVDVPADVSLNRSGCADGDREGFVEVVSYPDIAGCSGGWSVPGVMWQNPGTAPACPSLATYDTTDPACGRRAGNDGANPDGNGCNVADLCESGWHVCTSAADITAHSPSGCGGATQPNDPPLFFASRQSSNGCEQCATGSRTGSDCNSVSCTGGCAQTASTSNDVFGCGSLGLDTGFVGCGPIDRFSYNLCSALGNDWSCNDDGSGLCEAYAIVHTGPAFGGVLCCRD